MTQSDESHAHAITAARGSGNPFKQAGRLMKRDQIGDARRLFDEASKQVDGLTKRDQIDEARRLLLDAASGPAPDPQARRVYEDLFPLTPGQKQWMRETLMNLSVKDAKARAKAARDVGRAATLGFSRYSRWVELVADPRCMDYIVPSLKSDDPKVAECAVTALAQAAQWRYRDWRGWEPVNLLLKAKRPNTRRWAVRAAGYLGGEKAVDVILPLIQDKAELPRNEVAMTLINMLQKDVLSADAKSSLTAKLMPYLESEAPETRKIATNVVRTLNDPAAALAVRAALRNERNKVARESMEYAVRCLEAGDPMLPV